MNLPLSARGAASLAAAIALTTAVAGCSGSNGGDNSGSQSTVVWSTWGSPEELTRFKEFNAEFMNRHPDIKVTLQPVASYDDYHAKLLAQFTSGTAPDVFYIGDDRLGQFVNADVLMPLKELMESDKSETGPGDFIEGLFGAAAKDGEYYAAPNDCNPDALWYDKTALNEAGISEDPAELAADGQWTTEKFLQMNDKLAAADLTGTIFWNYWATHDSWITSQGGSVYDGDGAYVANADPTSVAAVDTLGEYFQDDKFKLADLMPEGAGADTVFLTHKAGFFAQGRYTIGTVRSGGEEENYDIVPWPTPDGQQPSTGVAASYLAINADTDSKDAAFTFWTEFLSAEGQTFRLQGGGNAVPSIEGADEVVLEDNYPAHAQTFLAMRDSGYANFPSEAVVPGLSTDISERMLALYRGKSDAQATLDDVAAMVDDAVTS